MKRSMMVAAAILMGVLAKAAPGTDSTSTFKVSGNCGMCQNRIEKAAKAAGATTAKWYEDSKMMTVSFNPKKSGSEKIQQKIAAVGHDAGTFKASDEVYENLPGCCQYRDGGGH